MIRNTIRSITQKLGYDFVKTSSFEYGRRFKKQSGEREYDYYETPNGNYYFPKNCNGDDIANTIKRGGLFDEPILELSKQYIKPNTTVLDLGANFGQMAIEFSRVASNVKVFAFEAQDKIYKVLCKNLQANNADNVTPIHRAVYDSPDLDLIFPVPDLVRFKTYGSYGIDLSAKSGAVVKSTTIDSLDVDLPVSFMKIDIQGSDLFAMKGAINTIQKYRMPIIFEYEEGFQKDFNTSFQDYVSFVDEIGYRFLKTIQDINFLIVPA